MIYLFKLSSKLRVAKHLNNTEIYEKTILARLKVSKVLFIFKKMKNYYF